MNQVTHVQLGLVRKAPEPVKIATSQECGKNGLSRPQASWRGLRSLHHLRRELILQHIPTIWLDPL